MKPPSEYEDHPATSLFPPGMSDAEIDDLAADILKHGLKEPIAWVRTGGAFPVARIVDGRNRYRACRIAGVKPRFVELPEDTDVHAYVVSANLHRRHLTVELRKELAVKLMVADPSKSNLAIAQQVKLSDKTIAAERESHPEIPNVKRTGTNGRKVGEKPARKPGAAKQSPKLNRDDAVVKFVAVLRARPRDTLGDLVHLLRDERAGIEKVSMTARIELANDLLRALGVGIDDLRLAKPLAAEPPKAEPPKAEPPKAEPTPTLVIPARPRFRRRDHTVMQPTTDEEAEVNRDIRARLAMPPKPTTIEIAAAAG